MEKPAQYPRIIVAYDGSASADAAVDDLRRCGIVSAEALVVSVAEHWMPELALSGDAHRSAEDEDLLVSRGLHAASALASHAAGKLRSVRPGWSVGFKALSGSPAPEILKEAVRFKADLIVIGSRGRTPDGALVFGGIAQKIVGDSNCSVRIGRASAGSPEGAVIAIGFDGSPGSYEAVKAVAGREWGGGCRIHLVTASEEIVPSGIARFGSTAVAWIEKEERTGREILRKLAESALRTLERAGCEVTLSVNNGNPRQMLAVEAARLGADCIFVGANSAGSTKDRSMLGSTSAAAAARAGCSVEVVRASRRGKK